MPVAGTFLVFLRNFSKGLRNAGACESKRPADRDAFVQLRARERGSEMLINAIFSDPNRKKPGTEDTNKNSQK